MSPPNKNIPLFLDLYIECMITLIIDFLGKKKTIKAYMDEIKVHIDDTDDPNVLDRVLAFVIQADAALQMTITSEDTQLRTFEKKNHFVSTQKNETQLCFKKTTGTPGRKKQNGTMR